MPSDTISERVRSLETAILHTTNRAEVARIEAQFDALREVVNLYIERKDYHNAKLDDRVSDLFANYIGLNKEMGIVRVFALAALGLAVTILGSILVGLVK